MKTFFRLALHPVPEPERFDTSLRYTDILFGFVIRELFLRLQNWTQLDRAVQLHLLVGATLVLGSWIGFRRSLYRSSYQLKFFNLPLFRFIVDQAMLILYFRMAVLTDVGGKQVAAVTNLSNSTIRLVMYIFVLYTVWDLLGIWIAKTKTAGMGSKPLYPEIVNSQMTDKEQSINWPGLSITVGGLGLVVLLSLFAACLTPDGEFVATITLLLLYRWAKEMRTSWQSLPRT
jgi:hypothetical protein